MQKSSKPGRLQICLILLYFILPSNSNAYYYEVAIRAKDRDSNPISINVTVYQYNSDTKNFDQLRTGNTKTSQFWVGNGGQLYNGAFDIRLDGMYEKNCSMFAPLPEAQVYYLRIGNKYFKLDYQPNYETPPYVINYGDMMFEYSGGNVILVYKSSGCAYVVTGPFDWQEKAITLKNDFGSDRTNCFGNMYFDTQLLENVGYSGTTLNREAITFPHMASGIDNQFTNNYYRKWRSWDDSDPSISKVLSLSQDYNLTAKYAKELNINIRNSFDGGTIKIQGISNGCPVKELHFYDDNCYQIEAVNQLKDSVFYQFTNWNYKGVTYSQNPLTLYYPDAHVDLTAVFTGTPSFSGTFRKLSIQQTVNTPIRLTWNEHPNPDVTHYKIYRKVKDTPSWVNGEYLATLFRGTRIFDDPDYVFTNDSRTILLYDVRAYCQAYGTESAPSFEGPAYGKLIKSANDLTSEKLTNSLSNFPNPFNPTTTIKYSVASNGRVELKVFDILGKEVATLVNEVKVPGEYQVIFDGSNLISGIYFYSLKAGDYVSTKKLMLVK